MVCPYVQRPWVLPGRRTWYLSLNPVTSLGRQVTSRGVSVQGQQSNGRIGRKVAGAGDAGPKTEIPMVLTSILRWRGSDRGPCRIHARMLKRRFWWAVR